MAPASSLRGAGLILGLLGLDIIPRSTAKTFRTEPTPVQLLDQPLGGTHRLQVRQGGEGLENKSDSRTSMHRSWGTRN